MANSKIPAKVKSKSFSGTTDASGHLTIASNEKLFVVLVATDGGKAFPFCAYGNTILSCYHFNNNILSNAYISGTLYYI